MIFGMITSNQSMEKDESYVTQILTALSFILKLKILLMMLKDLIHLTMKNMIKDHFQ